MKCFCVSVCLFLASAAVMAEEAARTAVVERLRADIEFFAADEQQGRGVATEGIERSAERIIEEYERTGLKPGLPDGSWRQTFPVRTGSLTAAEGSSVRLKSPDGRYLDFPIGVDCQPLLRGKAGAVTAPLVFVGYGISAPEFDYSEYQKVDVTGKVVIVIRRVPGRGDPEAPFSGEKTSAHAYIDTKLREAHRHGAAAVLFVNDPASEPDAETEQLPGIDGFGTRSAFMPFVHVKQQAIDRLLSQQPVRTPDGQSLRTLSSVAGWIDEHMEPLSQELTGWEAEVRVKFTGRSVNASNLVGVVEGQGPLSHETIIVGAHYDHIGYGHFGSRARGRRGEVHNGADDNASGTAALLELARRMVAGPAPHRRIVFICFSAEERGLLGSRYYVRHPVFPLEDTVFMFNLDMVGSVRRHRIEVNGVGTGAEFLPLVRQADEESVLDVRIVANPFGGSDHLPFYRSQIPVLFCFSGITDRYHTPDDDAELINVEGVADVVDLAEHLLLAVDGLPQRPSYRRSPRGRVQMAVLGVQPDLSADGDEVGVRVLGIRPGSPAADSLLQTGDVIVSIGARSIADYADLSDFLLEASGGDTVMLTVNRDGRKIRFSVTLGQTGR